MRNDFTALSQKEGDRREFVSEEGYPCLIVRHPDMGHLCGYVAVPKGHPVFDKGYDDIDARVHGGLTYAQDHSPRKEPDGNWWLGFDCAHCDDFIPGMDYHHPSNVYRDMSYVEQECRNLAKQLKEKEAS